MNELSRKNSAGKLKGVIFDWAGTTVDYGCFAPTGVFMEVFRQKCIEITMAEARGQMGKHKRDHIRTITQYPCISEEWLVKYGHYCTDEDIEDMFRKFIPLQLSVIEKYSDISPELPDALKAIREMDMKIGSTTGYNNEMMKILTSAAAKQGYVADPVVCAADVPSGRPAPWMAFKNAENLNIFPMHALVKIGDTISDIDKANNAGMWSVGVVNPSNEMGLTQKETNIMEPSELEKRRKKVREDYFNAGADYVIDSLAELAEIIEKINSRLALGEKP